MASDKVAVEVAGRTLALSNLDKALYPDVGFTKGEVIEYYVAVADALLPHLANRILTRKRWPNGTAADPFFEKNAPRGTPPWVRTVLMPEHGQGGVEYVVADSLPTLVWLANLAALELHVPQWTVDVDDQPQGADLLVFDLDPGPPATVVDCVDVAFPLKQLLEADGLTAYAKTSGNKGAQLYVPIEPVASDKTSAYAKRMAERLEAALPDLVVSSMDKKLRRGKVFIDWSQNNGAKTTVAPYSLRGVDRPTASTPITWDEAGDAKKPEDLRFESADVVARIDELGDLFGDMDDYRAPLPG